MLLYSFLLCVILNLREISEYNPPQGLYLEGRFIGAFFAVRVWGAYLRNFIVFALHLEITQTQTHASVISVVILTNFRIELSFVLTLFKSFTSDQHQISPRNISAL